MKTFVDFFCGAGGYSLGMVRAGWKHLAGFELDKDAAETYSHNIGTCYETDIKALPWTGVIAAVGCIPNHAHFSPPCPDFSQAGQGEGWQGERGVLMNEVTRLLSEAASTGTQPESFSVENVPGLLLPKHVSGFSKWIETLRGIGYTVEYRIVDASEHGVPQKRERLLVFGFYGTDAVFNWPPAEFGAEKPLVSVSECVYGLDDPLGFCLARRRKRKGGYVFEVVPVDGPSYTLAATHGEGARLYTLFDVEGVEMSEKQRAMAKEFMRRLPCVGSWPEPKKRITPKQCARIQTFPDWFRFAGSMTSQYRQIGNAVPPLLAETLTKSLLGGKRHV
jgi:DNA (cytosine-5)-methyltransferase 1